MCVCGDCVRLVEAVCVCVYGGGCVCMVEGVCVCWKVCVYGGGCVCVCLKHCDEPTLTHA